MARNQVQQTPKTYGTGQAEADGPHPLAYGRGCCDSASYGAGGPDRTTVVEVDDGLVPWRPCEVGPLACQGDMSMMGAAPRARVKEEEHNWGVLGYSHAK